jgi:hypothetical protein
LANGAWLDAADALARQVLDPAFDVPALENAVLDMPLLHGERRAEANASTRLAQQLCAEQPDLRCAWWCEGALEVRDFVLAATLPVGAAFDTLLQGAPAGD